MANTTMAQKTCCDVAPSIRLASLSLLHNVAAFCICRQIQICSTGRWVPKVRPLSAFAPFLEI
jgi:hypothetical protein